MHRSAIVWFRRDLRLADNPALAHALSHAERIAPTVVESDTAALATPGPASLAWRALSLDSLETSIRKRGGSLLRVRGPAPAALVRAANASAATLVTCNRDWTPSALAEERLVHDALSDSGIVLHVTEGQLLVPPGAVTTVSGAPYSVFTPFSRAWMGAWSVDAPLPPPGRILGPTTVRQPGLEESPFHKSPVSCDVAAHWTPGEPGAQARLTAFVERALSAYDVNRDRPALPGTSMLSPHLAWGEISPRQVAAAVMTMWSEAIAWPFLRQLAWREFAYHVLYAHPETTGVPLRREFAAFPWRDDAVGEAAWLAGRTGFPLVDAGMRQLAQTGWMHNRVRLVAASFLTKDLLVPWQTGEAAFRDRLVDFDQASNVFNWQWVAGSGADAAPYFRVFNPATQGARFDAGGEYVRRWVPELARLDSRWIHRPQLAPLAELAGAGVVIGETYPEPIVDHAEARLRALAALASVRGARFRTPRA